MAKKRAKLSIVYIIIFIAIVAAVTEMSFQFSQPKACTLEAKICPDGSAVGRIPPDCNFAPCPSCKCPEGYVQDGDVCNPKCYYSTPRCLAPSFLCNATSTSYETSCASDSDCIGATCCHPSSCINKAYRGVCNELCTQVCQGPLDCGAGRCGCINNVCAVIPS